MSITKRLKKAKKKINKETKKLIDKGKHEAEKDIKKLKELKKIEENIEKIIKEAKKLDSPDIQKKLIHQAKLEMKKYSEFYELISPIAHNLNTSTNKEKLMKKYLIPIISKKAKGKKASSLIDEFFAEEHFSPLHTGMKNLSLPGGHPTNHPLEKYITLTCELAGEVEDIGGFQAAAGIAKQMDGSSHAAYLDFGGTVGVQGGGAVSLVFGLWLRNPAVKVDGPYIGIEVAGEVVVGATGGAYFDLDWPKNYSAKSFQGLAAGPGLGVEGAIDLAVGYLFARKF